MTYPDDQVAAALRVMCGDIAETADMMAETFHDNPKIVARAIDNEDAENLAVQELISLIREEHGELPCHSELVPVLVSSSIEYVQNGNAELEGDR